MIDFPESKGLMKEGALYPIEGSLSGAVFRSAKPLVLNSLAEGNSVWSFRSSVLQKSHGRGPFSVWLFSSVGQREPSFECASANESRRAFFAKHDVEFFSQVACMFEGDCGLFAAAATRTYEC
jgi:hypothetical protein